MAVFLSYASEDAAAAARIAQALECAGVDVWFDRSELRGGDAWDQSIRRQILTCSLFVAVISANTQSRLEGYFRREWKLAVARSDDMADARPFLVPIVIDDTSEADAHVPTKFLEVQWTRLRGGVANSAFVERIGFLLRSLQSKPAVDLVERAVRPPQRAAVAQRALSAKLWVLSISGAALAFLAIVAALTHHSFIKARGASETSTAIAEANSDRTLLVLPFANLSPHQDEEYFADGLTEELINRLSRVRGLHVIGRGSAFYFKGRSTPISDLVRTLHVTHVLEGSVQRTGQLVRIRAELVQASKEYQLWSEEFDRNADDILHTQDEIAAAVSAALNSTFVADLNGEPPPHNVEAYYRLLRANYLSRQFNAVDTAESINLARQAIALDPSYGAAWTRLSMAYSHQIEEGNLDAPRGAALIRDAAQHAVAAAPSSGLAHIAMAYSRLLDRDYASMRSEIDTAERLLGGPAVNTRGLLALSEGNAPSAIATYRTALASDPLNTLWLANLRDAFACNGDWLDAEHTGRRLLSVVPSAEGVHAGIALSLTMRGQVAQALGEASKEPNEERRLLSRAIALAAARQANELTQATNEFRKRFANSRPDDMADLEAIAGQADAAFDWLTYAEQRMPSLLSSIQCDPLLWSIHSDRRWAALTRRLRLPTVNSAK